MIHFHLYDMFKNQGNLTLLIVAVKGVFVKRQSMCYTVFAKKNL